MTNRAVAWKISEMLGDNPEGEFCLKVAGPYDEMNHFKLLLVNEANGKEKTITYFPDMDEAEFKMEFLEAEFSFETIWDVD